MFNGIINYTGRVKNILIKKNDCILEILTKMKFSKKEVGSSISCSGVCLTLENFKKNMIKFYVSKETLSKSNFKVTKRGDIINLEKSLSFGQRVSGHFVQGHVDTTCVVNKIKIIGKSWLITFKLPNKHKKLLVSKASITINGVSLTIAKIIKNGFQIAIIPKTLQLTNLIYLKKKDLVNIEFDILSKYIKNFMR